MRVTLTAAPGASQRTRNRIKEHGPEFEVMSLGANKGLYRSPDGWYGWIPYEEVRSALVRE